MAIYQGSNDPIIVELDASECASLYACPDIHAMLYHSSGIELMHWTKESMQISGRTATLPLTQEETAAMETGTAFFEFKWLTPEGHVRQLTPISVYINPYHDKHILTTGEEDILNG